MVLHGYHYHPTFGSTTFVPLALNYDKFSSGAQFQSSIYEKAGKILNLSKNSPTIKYISIQGTAAIITIEPFPENKDEEVKLIKELESSTGLQIFLLSDPN